MPWNRSQIDADLQGVLEGLSSKLAEERLLFETRIVLSERCRDEGKVLISGGTSNMLGLAERIQETFGYPTEVMNPFKSITVGPKVDGAKARSLGPALAVAVGLALRGFDQ